MIEHFLGKKITVLEIQNKDYHQTLDFTKDTTHDWKSVMREIGELKEAQGKKRKKRRKG